MATCTEFKNGDFPTNENLDVLCNESTISAGPVNLSAGASMNLINQTGGFNLAALSTSSGGDITVQGGSDITLNDVSSGRNITIIAGSGKVTINGIVTAEGFIRIFANSGEIVINNSVTQSMVGDGGPIEIVGDAKVTINGELMGKKAVKVESTNNEVDIQQKITQGNSQSQDVLEILASQMITLNGEIDSKGPITINSSSGEVMIMKKLTQTGSELGPVDIDSGGKITITEALSVENSLLIDAGDGLIEISSTIEYAGSKGGADRIELTTVNGDIKLSKELDAGGAFLRMTAKQGKIDITADIKAPNNQALFVSDKEVKLNNVDVSGNTTAGQDRGGSIQIMVNQDGSTNGQFVIGGSGHTNGVNGKLQAVTDTGGGNDTERWSGGILVFNKGTGGIKLDKVSDILVRANSSKNGVIVLDADEGNIDMPTTAGTLSVNGQNENSAGLIALIAQDINFPSKMILTASDTVSGSGLQHTVALSAENINIDSSDGLDLRSNGDGDSTWISAVDLFPKGALDVNIRSVGSSFDYTLVTPNGFDGTDASLNINGSGPLNITANGSNSQIRLTGNPVNFSNEGNVKFVCNGKENNNIAISYSGTSSPGSDGITFSEGFEYEFLANGLEGGNGGSILLALPAISFAQGTKLTCRANGEGSGNGGIVTVNATNGGISNSGSSMDVELIANGGSAGGNGGSVSTLATDDITLETTSFRAIAIAQGDGGNISINSTKDVGLDDCILNAAAGTLGKGGIITINGDNIKFNELGSLPISYRALGGTASGDGGSVTITAEKGLTVGQSVTLQASAIGNGAGGDIVLTSNGGDINLDKIDVSLVSKGFGTGKGGNITLRTDNNKLTSNATLNVSAEGTDDAGNITIIAKSAEMREQSLLADGIGDGANGGRINLQLENIIDDGMNLSASGRNEGNGGTIDLQFTDTNQIAFNGKANVTGGDSAGDGGNVNITAKGPFTISSVSEINANAPAESNAKGGTIIIFMENNFVMDGKLLASSSIGGQGGLIAINTPEFNILDGEIRASGTGGIINIFDGSNSSGKFSFLKESTDATKGVIAANSPTAATSPGASAGSVSITNAQGEIIVGSGFAIRANAAASTNLNGGSIFISSESSKLTASGIIAANGDGAGLGGIVIINVPELEVTDGEIRAIGNDGLINIIDNTNGGSGSGGAFLFKKISGDAAKGTVSVNSNQSDGTTAGRIVLSKLSGDITFDGLFALRANGGNASNANGGNIEVSAKRIVPASNGPVALTAKGFGSGNGGKITVFQTESEGLGIPFTFHPTGFSVDVSSAGAGDAGETTVASFGVVDFDGASCVSNAGPNGNGNGGKTTVASTGSTINVGTNLFVKGDIKNNGTGTGKGGTIIWDAQGINFGAGKIQANGGSSSGAGGEVIVNDRDNIASLVFPTGISIEAKGAGATVTISKDPEVLLLGNATIATSGAGSKLTIQPRTNKSLTILIEADAKLNAESDSTILLTAGGNNLTVNALSSNGVPIIGTLELAGDNIDCSINSNVPLTAGNWAALEDISLLNSGSGTVSQVTGTKVTGNKLTLDLAANFGVSIAPISTQVSSLQIDVGGAFLTNDSETLTVLDGAKSAGTISIEGNSISIGDLTSEAGSVSILATSGTLLVRQRLFGDGTLVANGGDLMIQGGSGLIVSTTDRLVAAGDISISIGPIGADPSCVQTTNTEPSCAPANVDGTVSNGGAIFWGAGISASPGVTVDTNGRIVKIEPNGGALQLQAGVAVSAF